MEDIKSKVKLDWEEIERLVSIIAAKITLKPKGIQNIYGCPRGGLIPAVLLSHKLGIPLITDESKINVSTLIVDDICDTGDTFTKLATKHITPNFAALHLRGGNLFPCIYAAEVINDWIVYPWEDERADAIQDYLKV